MDALIGHAHLLSYFRQAKERGALGHAYMLVGPRHVGKQTLAELVSAEVLGISRDTLARHPDVFMLTRGVHEKTGKTKKFIDIEEVRELTRRLSEAAFLGGYTVALIDGAEDMSQGAANAFLKTLEEPKPQTLVWLLVEQVSQVPATIRSRCQVFFLEPVAEQDIVNALQERGIDVGNATRMAQHALGRPGRALHATQVGFEDDWAKEAERFVSLFGASLSEKMAKVEDLVGDTDDATQSRDTLKDVFALWHIALVDMARGVHNRPSRLVPHGPGTSLVNPEWQSISQRIDEAIHHLSSNGNPRLLIEHILLAIP